MPKSGEHPFTLQNQHPQTLLGYTGTDPVVERSRSAVNLCTELNELYSLKVLDTRRKFRDMRGHHEGAILARCEARQDRQACIRGIFQIRSFEHLVEEHECVGALSE